MATIIDSLNRANLGWQYYKNYYESNRNQSLDDKNETIIKRAFEDSNEFFKIGCKHFFELSVNYPGLLTGSGYTHEYTGDDKDGAFKIGFFFDHISGMPYITGHGIKGALRNAFPNHKKERYPEQKARFIADLLKGKNIDTKKVFDKYLQQENIHNVPYSDLAFASLLGKLIFEGCKPIAYKNNEFTFSQLPLKDKDIFYDCYISKGGNNNLFLADDFITPHIPNPLKNPVPIKFLKILPGVEFRFQFDLKDNLIGAEQKKELFKSIILALGIGAKTNVGYGQFSPVGDKLDNKANGSGNEETHVTEGSSILNEITKASDPITKKIQAGSEWKGLIKAEKNDNFIIEFLVEDQVVKLKKKKKKIDGGALGSMIRLRFKTPFDNDNPDFSVTVIE